MLIELRTKEGKIVGMPFNDDGLTYTEWTWEELLHFCRVRHNYRPVSVYRLMETLTFTVELVE